VTPTTHSVKGTHITIQKIFLDKRYNESQTLDIVPNVEIGYHWGKATKLDYIALSSHVKMKENSEALEQITMSRIELNNKYYI
jgi:hypothetical protein